MVSSVVDKFIIKLEAQLEPKKVVLIVDETARRWLAEKGYDRLMGADFGRGFTMNAHFPPAEGGAIGKQV